MTLKKYSPGWMDVKAILRVADRYQKEISKKGEDDKNTYAVVNQLQILLLIKNATFLNRSKAQLIANCIIIAMSS